MSEAGELLTFAAGFTGVGVGVGLSLYHFGLGWVVSRSSLERLEGVLAEAEEHVRRRHERRVGSRRRRRVLAEHGEGRPPGRHEVR